MDKNVKDMMTEENRIIVDVVGHCLFCLRWCHDSEDLLEETLPPELGFSHLWQYVHDRWKSNSPPNYSFAIGVSQNGACKYSNIPPMCEACSDTIVKLDRLHKNMVEIERKLEEQKNRVQKVIRGSNERFQSFENVANHSTADIADISNARGLIKLLKSPSAPITVVADLSPRRRRTDSEFANSIDHFPNKSSSVLDIADDLVKIELDDDFKLNAATEEDNVLPEIKDEPVDIVAENTQIKTVTLISSSAASSSSRKRRKQTYVTQVNPVLGISGSTTEFEYNLKTKPIPMNIENTLSHTIPEQFPVLNKAVEDIESNTTSPNPYIKAELHGPDEPVNFDFSLMQPHIEILTPTTLTSTNTRKRRKQNLCTIQEEPMPTIPLSSGLITRSQFSVSASLLFGASLSNVGHVADPLGEVSGTTSGSKAVVKKRVNPVKRNPVRPACTRSVSILNRRKIKLGPRPKRDRSKNAVKPLPKRICEICNEEVACVEMFYHLCGHVPPEYIRLCVNPNCNYLFIAESSLERHLKTIMCSQVVSARERKCETCGATLSNGLSLKTHLQRHETITKNFTCPFDTCNESFSVRQNLNLHFGKHTYKPPAENGQRCSQCSKYILFHDLQKHLTEEHKLMLTFPCKSCSAIFPVRLELIEHQMVHLEIGVSCDICNDDVKYSRLRNLRQHYLVEHEIGGEEKGVCHHCGGKFSGLHSHIQRMHGNLIEKKKTEFKCDLCLETISFTSEDSLVSHKIREHGAEPFGCSICKQTFSSRLLFQRHEKMHAGITEQTTKYKCDICGRKFGGNKGLLEHHMKKQHSDGPAEKEFVCDICGKGYSTKQGVNDHKAATHDGVRHVCHVCGRQFTCTTSLRRHLLIHTGERPYTCDICKQKFRQRETLSTHIKSHKTRGDEFKPTGPIERGVRKRQNRK